MKISLDLDFHKGRKKQKESERRNIGDVRMAQLSLDAEIKSLRDRYYRMANGSHTGICLSIHKRYLYKTKLPILKRNIEHTYCVSGSVLKVPTMEEMFNG